MGCCGQQLTNGAVIEYYVTSSLSGTLLTGVPNMKLRNKALTAIQQCGLYARGLGGLDPTRQTISCHIGAIPAYMYGMKFMDNEKWRDVIAKYQQREEQKPKNWVKNPTKTYYFPTHENARVPNCRVPTRELKTWCGQTDTNKECTKSTYWKET